MNASQLTDNAWINNLSKEARGKLIEIARYRRYVVNQQVHQKMSDSDGLYGVISGEVRVSATTFDGAEIVFTRIHPGDWFGEIGLFDGGVRTHDATATLETVMAVLPKDPLLAICDDYPDVKHAIVNLLCSHCRQAFSVIDDFLLFSPTQRLAKRMLSIADASNNLTLSLSQQELGSLVGISRQSANKSFRRWEQQGLIQRGYGKIKILDREAIESLLTN